MKIFHENARHFIGESYVFFSTESAMALQKKIPEKLAHGKKHQSHFRIPQPRIQRPKCIERFENYVLGSMLSRPVAQVSHIDPIFFPGHPVVQFSIIFSC